MKHLNMLLVMLAAGLCLAAPGRAAAQPAKPDTPADGEPAARPGELAVPEDSPILASAQAYTLGQVLQVAVRQRPSLLEAAIDVDIAEAAVLRAAGLDDWVFDATLSWVSVRVPGIGAEVGDRNAPTLDLHDRDRISLSGNLGRSFASGGTLTLSAQTAYTRQAYTFYAGGGVSMDDAFDLYEHSLGATFVQPLLRGRGERIARAAQRQARIMRDAASLQMQSEAITAVREVVRAYWELAYALRDVQIRKYSLSLAQERLRNTRLGIDAGAIAPTEALAVLQSIATREQEIVAAELAIYQRSLELRRLVGLEIEPGAIVIRTDAPLAVEPKPLDLAALLGRAYEQSPVLAALDLQAKNAEIEVELTDNGLLPELDAALSLGPTGSADDPGTAFINMVKIEDVTVSASLTYRDTIGKRAARGNHMRARAELRRQKLSIADIKAQIASALVLAVKQAEAAQKRIELSRQAIELAEKNIEAEMARFELGRATNFDVLQRQTELQQAQLGRARAIVDYLDAVTAAAAITGDLLDTYGITLEIPAGR